MSCVCSKRLLNCFFITLPVLCTREIWITAFLLSGCNPHRNGLMLNICGNHILVRENSTRRPSHKFLPAVTHRITFMLWLSFSLAQSRDNTILFPSLFSTIRPLMINIHRFPDSFLTRAFQSYILFLGVVSIVSLERECDFAPIDLFYRDIIISYCKTIGDKLSVSL